MYYYIDGNVAYIEAGLAVIDCGGVGYALNTTTASLSHLRIGERARLYTFTYIREDTFDLYGFYSLSEKRCFELLLAVSGVGPKAALSVLSSTTPESLAMAIISSDEKVLIAAPGIGKKIAQRIILELKDKIANDMQGIAFPTASTLSKPGPASSKTGDAVAALAVLGYGNSEIAVALRDIDCESMALEDIIKQALKVLAKAL